MRSGILLALLLASAAGAQNVRIIRFAESTPFQMGSVTSRRILHPDLGARNLTLNFSVTRRGAEFAQHSHDESSDTILMLKGEADLRQGDSRRRFRTGECVFLPAGQIHGTVTTGPGDNIMISFQTPPDRKLYAGARDSSKPGAAPPSGAITPGAVKYLRFDQRNGEFVNPAMGSKHASASHWRLKRSRTFQSEAGAGAERFVFVWRGEVEVTLGGEVHTAGERDTAFVTYPGVLSVRALSDEAVVIHVQAPPGVSR